MLKSEDIKSCWNDIANTDYSDYELAFLIAVILSDEVTSADDITNELIEKIDEIRNQSSELIDYDLAASIRAAYEELNS